MTRSDVVGSTRRRRRARRSRGARWSSRGRCRRRAGSRTRTRPSRGTRRASWRGPAPPPRPTRSTDGGSSRTAAWSSPPRSNPNSSKCSSRRCTIRHRPHRAGLEERDPQARVALEDAVRDERGEREHLLGDEVRGVHRREVVVEAAPATRRTGRGRSCPGGWRTARRPPRGTTTAARTPRPAGGGGRRSARGAATRRGSRAPRRSGGPRASASSALGHRERGDADQVLGIVRAVLGDPVVDRAAQRQRRLALGDALDHQPERRVQRGRARCGRRPCRRGGDRARCRRARAIGSSDEVRRLARCAPSTSLRPAIRNPMRSPHAKR